MSWDRTVLSALLAGIILSSGFAENAAAQVPVRPGPSAAPGTTSRPPRQEPCWQIAGVSKSTLHQRRAIEQQSRQQVEGVCANSSLTVQQKRVQIKQIHEREHQEIDGLISPAQQEAIRTCQEQRHGAHGGGHVGGGHGNPCGELATGHKNYPMEEEETPPNGTTKPN